MAQGRRRIVGWALLLCTLAGCSAAPPPKRTAAKAAPEPGPAVPVDPNLPCWVEMPNCGGVSGVLYFVGAVATGAPPGLDPDVRKKAATSVALSRYSFNLRTRVKSEDTVRQSCTRSGRQIEQCMDDYQSNLSLDTQSLMKSGDFDLVDEYFSSQRERFYVRVAVPLSKFRLRVKEIVDFAVLQ